MTRLRALFAAALFFFSTAVFAATDLKVLFDTDHSAGTGCVVAGMQGVDKVLTTNVETTGTPRVLLVSGQTCFAGALGAPELLNTAGWPVSVNPVTGEFSVETQVLASFFGGTIPHGMRLGFVASSGSSTAIVLDTLDDAPILFPVVPARHRIIGAGNSPHIDGNDSEWQGIAPLVEGGSTNGTAALRILSVQAWFAGDAIYFRFLAQSSPNAPTAADDSYSTTPGTPINIAAPGVLANDTDPRGLPLTASLVRDVSHGALVLNPDGSFSYSDDGSGAQRDHFTYRASNGEQQSNIARVDLGISDHPNTRPTAADDTYEVGIGETLNVFPPGLLTNDSDADADTLTVILDSVPAHGTLTLNSNGSFTYAHDGLSTAADSFTYFAFDGLVRSLAATVHINVRPNLPPLAIGDAYTVNEGGTLTVLPRGVLTNDTDPDTNPLLLRAVLGTGPANGTLTLNSNGSFTYIHNGSETLTDSFTYRANDGRSNSNLATVTITITPQPDAPIANPDSYTTNEDTPLTVPAPGVLGNDTDLDTLPAGLSAILDANVTNGTLALAANGGFNYTPNANFNGTDSFTYHVNDGGLNSNIATVTITVTAVNDVPSFTGGPNVSVPSDNGPYSAPWATAISAGPANEGGQALNFIVSNNNNALFSVQPAISPSGVLTFTPSGLTIGVATVTVQLQDNGGTANGGIDTSTPPITFTITITCPTITVTNPAVTTATAGSAFSQAFTQSGGVAPVTFTTASALPAGLTLSPAGVLSGTPTVTGTFPIVVTATDLNGCTGTSATYNLVVGCPTITVTNPANSNGTAGTPFSETFTQSGGIGAVTFATASTLPAGMTLSAAGVLSGTPTQFGTFPIVVTATDANGCTGTGATYTLIIACPVITVTNPANANGTTGVAFSETFTQTGGVGATTFSTASTLPAGLTLSTAGVLSGTPTQFGTFPIVVTATDSNGCTGTGTTYNLVIVCQTITVTNPANTAGTVNAAFSETFTQTGANGVATFTTSSTLPAGLTLATNGVLSGTPTQTGSFPIVVTVTDSNGCTGTSATYTLVIACQTITVNNPANGNGTAGAAFSETFTTTNAVAPVTFTINSGTLPAGLTLAANGTLSGTPTQTGTFPITVTATDANGCTGTSATYTIVIACQVITVTNPANTNGTANAAFSETFTQTGAIGSATFTTASTLPTGITLATNGVLSGTPTVTGTFPIVVTVTDANGCTGTSATYNLVIACQTITVTNPVNTNGVVNTPFSETFTQSGSIGTATFTTASTLPAGMTLTTAGVLSGTPTQSGTFPSS